ncbi:hypothetical protein Pla108_00970 [Botrimarina colliarenosi]|uniref:Uncharacterized protein n=1 Tax=Botrimarina colliarenosi TaxID=2528001 RepID=A0A5C6ALV8_9BACT|nr:hypothetical protein [Botrimarina colliarenosi]TWT99163.1 hypothetical protein Pla108_00970 [Botrimarina colliarenosi]
MALSTEPIELRLPRRVDRAAVTSDALDEAFAAVTSDGLRRDTGHVSGPESEGLTPDLAALLRNQLTALDAQRRHLAQLLSDLA